LSIYWSNNFIINEAEISENKTFKEYLKVQKEGNKEVKRG
jgi:hypothetical protein